MHAHTRAFPVHSYEVDAFGELTAPSLAGYLQEIAGNHASALGWSLPELMRQGLTWVLARQRVEVAASIRAGDVLEVTTWPSGLDRLAALRDFRVRRQRDGLEVARAVSQWFVLDLETRRPVRPERVVTEVPADLPPHVFAPPPARLPALEGGHEEKRFRTRFSDIDVNQHVNNLSYVAWALESVPEETWRRQRLAALDVQFLAECHYGAAVLSRTAAAGQGVFRHAIVREEDGRELARLETDWLPRAGPA
ncbi:acyl-[acyl-carrier-protein] thioesterase [Anaeromyxobacter paludicola]|uniref:Acyl-ACP thioesterase n=1 Tax=Anaeromyxobacter paludicola TaxID=2918171 RepID=A0ABN6N5P9_9BACT|nr:acyl-ACP thioesterase domain-containing protein [Anaeromyxobacter paludicola]BDG07349.1 acyl-ACP thioesterase [Anaeromyxobacter paludicola]